MYIFTKKLCSYESIGTIVTVLIDEDQPNSIFGPYKIEGHLDDKQRCIEWQAKDRFELATYESESKSKMTGTINTFSDTVEVLRNAYKTMTPSRRSLFIQQLVYEICK